jgi:hypothetical protein
MILLPVCGLTRSFAKLQPFYFIISSSAAHGKRPSLLSLQISLSVCVRLCMINQTLSAGGWQNICSIPIMWASSFFTPRSRFTAGVIDFWHSQQLTLLYYTWKERCCMPPIYPCDFNWRSHAPHHLLFICFCQREPLLLFYFNKQSAETKLHASAQKGWNGSAAIINFLSLSPSNLNNNFHLSAWLFF